VSIPCCTQVWKPSARAEQIFAQKLLPAFEKFCAERQHRWNQTELLMWCCNQIPFGHKILHEFMICLWQLWWPHLQVEAQGIVNHWLVRICEALCREKVLDIVGAASSGKSYIVAAYGYTLWKLKPNKTSVFLSTTSAEAGESRMWGFVKELHNMDQTKIGKQIASLRLLTLDEEVRDDEGVKNRDLKDVVKCVNIKQGQDGNNVIAAICGRKNDRVFWGCDEMDFMDLGVLNARVSLVPNPFSQFVGLNNSPDEGRPMYIDAEPHGPDFPDGWRSVDKDIHEEWPTRTGRCIYLNSDKCPNVQAKDPAKPPFPKLMTAQMRAEVIKSAGGIDTPMAWKYIYGFPPSVDIPDKVLTHKLLETNGCFEAPVWADNEQKTLAGLDLGWKEGGDPSAIHFGKVGKDTRAKGILGVEADAFTLTPSQKENRAYEVQISMRVIDECRKRNCHDLALDVTGDGGLMLQAIEAEARRQKYVLNVLAVSFAGSASDNPVMPGDARPGREIFDRRVSELWVSFRLSCLNGVIRGLGMHSNSKQQLCARKGTNDDRKRYTVEPKKEMKKRLKRSPDHADATVLLHTLALRHGISGAEVSKGVGARPRSPREALERALGAGGSAYSGHGGMGRYGGR
jgi:hypothetical protein